MHLAEAALPLICVAAATAGYLVQDLLKNYLYVNVV